MQPQDHPPNPNLLSSSELQELQEKFDQIRATQNPLEQDQAIVKTALDFGITQRECRRLYDLSEKPKSTSGLQKFLLWTGLSEKKGWDYFQLIFVTLGLAALTQFISVDRTRQETLNKYFDGIADLSFNRNLRGTKKSKVPEEEQNNLAQKEEARNIARAKTLTALRDLDPPRAIQLLRFLQEANLISSNEPIINLKDANLSGIQLNGAELSGINLSRVNLSKAGFSGSNLSNADLSYADLQDADLSNTNLCNTKLQKTNLRRANLRGAKLNFSELNKADLRDSDLTNTSLLKALLEDAKLDGAKLSGADFRLSNLSKKQLDKVRSKEGIKTSPLRQSNRQGTVVSVGYVSIGNPCGLPIYAEPGINSELINLVADGTYLEQDYGTVVYNGGYAWTPLYTGGWVASDYTYELESQNPPPQNKPKGK